MVSFGSSGGTVKGIDDEFVKIYDPEYEKREKDIADEVEKNLGNATWITSRQAKRKLQDQLRKEKEEQARKRLIELARIEKETMERRLKERESSVEYPTAEQVRKVIAVLEKKYAHRPSSKPIITGPLEKSPEPKPIKKTEPKRLIEQKPKALPEPEKLIYREPVYPPGIPVWDASTGKQIAGPLTPPAPVEQYKTYGTILDLKIGDIVNLIDGRKIEFSGLEDDYSYAQKHYVFVRIHKHEWTMMLRERFSASFIKQHNL